MDQVPNEGSTRADDADHSTVDDVLASLLLRGYAAFSGFWPSK